MEVSKRQKIQCHRELKLASQLVILFVILSGCSPYQNVIALEKSTGVVDHKRVLDQEKKEWQDQFVLNGLVLFKVTERIKIEKSGENVFLVSRVETSDPQTGAAKTVSLWKFDFVNGLAERLIAGAADFGTDTTGRYVCFEDFDNRVQIRSQKSEPKVVMKIFDIQENRISQIFELRDYQELISETTSDSIGYDQKENVFKFRLATKDWHIANCEIHLGQNKLEVLSVSREPFMP